jgi:hypothetical protein
MLPDQVLLGLEGKFSTGFTWFNLTSLGLQLTTVNIDKLNLPTIDLYVGYKKREFGSSTYDSESTDDNESLSWMAEDREDSDEGVNCDEHDEFRDTVRDTEDDGEEDVEENGEEGIEGDTESEED